MLKIPDLAEYLRLLQHSFDQMSESPQSKSMHPTLKVLLKEL